LGWSVDSELKETGKEAVVT